MSGRPKKGQTTGDWVKLNIGADRKVRVDSAMKEMGYKGSRKDFICDLIDQIIDAPGLETMTR